MLPCMAATSDGPILYYDGTCGLCASSVQFVLAHDQRREIRFGPLQGDSGRALAARFPVLNAVDSVVWVEDDTPRVRGDAVLALLRYLGGGWRVLAGILQRLPRSLRDACYDAVARRRHRLVARACLLPRLDDRARFLS